MRVGGARGAFVFINRVNLAFTSLSPLTPLRLLLSQDTLVPRSAGRPVPMT